MAEETEILDVPEDISEEQMDEMFKNGGELPEAKPETEEVIEEVKEEKKEEPKVNLGALHEERAKRKELQEKVAAMEERFKQVIERLNPEPATPTVEQDPVANFDTRIQEIEKFTASETQARERAQQEQAVISAYQHQAQEYTQQNPDFSEAYSYLVGNRIMELQTLGFDAVQAKQLAQQEEFGIALKSLQDGENPAERLYKIAKMRGYSKKEVKEVPQKDLKIVEKGVKFSKPEGNSAPEGELTLEAVAEMDDEEFDKAWKKLQKLNS